MYGQARQKLKIENKLMFRKKVKNKVHKIVQKINFIELTVPYCTPNKCFFLFYFFNTYGTGTVCINIWIFKPVSSILTARNLYWWGRSFLESYTYKQNTQWYVISYFSVYVFLMKRLCRNVHMHYGIFLEENGERSTLLPLNI